MSDTSDTNNGGLHRIMEMMREGQVYLSCCSISISIAITVSPNGISPTNLSIVSFLI